MSPKRKAKPSDKAPVSIPLPFDEAIRRAMNVKPPKGGWPEYEAKLKRARKKTAKRKKR